MAKKIVHQCAYNGKTFDSEEKALEDCEGPIQTFIKGHDRYPSRGFWGIRV